MSGSRREKLRRQSLPSGYHVRDERDVRTPFLVLKYLTLRYRIEDVVGDLVVGAAEAQSDAVLDVLDVVVVDLSIERLHPSDTGVLHVVDLVVVNLGVVRAAVQEDSGGLGAPVVDLVVVDLDVVAALGGDDTYRSNGGDAQRDKNGTHSDHQLLRIKRTSVSCGKSKLGSGSAPGC